MKYGKLILPPLIFAASFYFYLVATSFRQLKAIEQVGPDFWPRIILLGVMVLSVVAFLTEWKKEKGASPAQQEIKSEDWARAIWGGMLILAYILLLDYVGFALLTPIFMASFMVLLGSRKKWFIAAGSILFSAIMILVFAKLLYVALPRGMGIFRSFSLLFY